MKSLLETRPIYHKCDETIRGHVFRSFLALVLRKELQDRLERKGWHLEWADVMSDLDRLQGNRDEYRRQGVRGPDGNERNREQGFPNLRRRRASDTSPRGRFVRAAKPCHYAHAKLATHCLTVACDLAV